MRGRSSRPQFFRHGSKIDARRDLIVQDASGHDWLEVGIVYPELMAVPEGPWRKQSVLNISPPQIVNAASLRELARQSRNRYVYPLTDGRDGELKAVVHYIPAVARTTALLAIYRLTKPGQAITPPLEGRRILNLPFRIRR